MLTQSQTDAYALLIGQTSAYVTALLTLGASPTQKERDLQNRLVSAILLLLDCESRASTPTGPGGN
jgi:hypothetical protein